MGKSLKGKELGKGICQKGDGTYLARFVNRRGKRVEKCFKTPPEAKNWLENAKYEDRHSSALFSSETTLDQWFNYWIENVVGNRAPNTIRNYRERYTKDVSPLIGALKLTEIKPMHAQLVFKHMEKTYAGSTMKQTYTVLGALLKSARVNGMIETHPLDSVKTTKPSKAPDDIKFLTLKEQEMFVATAKNLKNYLQYSLLLETGLRVGEMIGLTWNKVDWINRTITINKTLEYRHNEGYWRAGPPKSFDSYRTIPLTNKAYAILEMLYAKVGERKEAPELSTVLEFLDLRSGKMDSFVMRDLVFISHRTGMPTKNSSYDTHLYKVCDKAGVKRISMHSLRHTYATRAIERNVNPKILQKLLGHSSVQMTMDRYVHVSTESMLEEIRKFEEPV